MKRKKRFSLSTVLLAFLALMAVLPLLPVLAASVSMDEAFYGAAYSFLPRGLSLNTIRLLLKTHGFWDAAAISGTAALVGTALSLPITAMLAYPMANPRCP